MRPQGFVLARDRQSIYIDAHGEERRCKEDLPAYSVTTRDLQFTIEEQEYYQQAVREIEDRNFYRKRLEQLLGEVVAGRLNRREVNKNSTVDRAPQLKRAAASDSAYNRHFLSLLPTHLAFR